MNRFNIKKHKSNFMAFFMTKNVRWNKNYLLAFMDNNTLIYTGIGGFTLGACLYYLAELFIG